MKNTNKYLMLTIVIIVLFSMVQANKFSYAEESVNKYVVGYYPAWKSYSGYTPDKIDVNKLTHINYAFAYIGSDFKISLGYPDKDPSNFEKFKELKKINPDIKILISVGGWDWSGMFSKVASTDETRNIFADSCVEFITKYGLDGVDIDWEYPVGGGLETNSKSPDDKQNFTLLLKEIREKLDKKGLKDNKHYMLTIATGASSYFINNIEADKIYKYLDYINLMTYDIHGPWDKYSDFNAPLYNNDDESLQYKVSVDSCVKAWLNAGLPKDKLIVGVPFYGYKYSVQKNNNEGLYQKQNNGIALSYESILKDYLNSSEYSRNFHEDSLVPWLYNGNTFISYDDPKSIALKAEYIKDNDLGGAMIWELSQDSDGSLLNSLYEGLKGDLITKDYQGHWAENVVQKWMDWGLIKGYPNGDFKPEELITRAEFVKMVNNIFGFKEIAEITFEDVNKDSWYYGEIQKAVKAGYIIGVSYTQFAPDAYITREQSAVIISRLLNLKGNTQNADKFTDNKQISAWAREYVGAAAELKLIKGYEDKTFKPQNNINRAEATVLLDRVSNYLIMQ